MKNPAVFDQLSEVLMQKGETEKAQKLLELGLQHGRHPTHLNNLACIYLAQGKKEEAEQLWKEAQEQLNQVPPRILENDSLLQQTLEKVKKNMKKLNS